jgi:uncharacterized lipoprotein YddW (UPF0748 family)
MQGNFCAYAQTQLPQESPKREFRGVWISTVYNLDFPTNAMDTPEKQRTDFVTLLEQHRKNGINAVFVQVRSAADAFYAGSREPWSAYLTGTQGKAPAPFWDPLAFMVEEAHKRGMEFHAWFNPFRSVLSSSSVVARDHISQTQPAWHLTYRSPFKLLNPGLPEVREYVAGVVADVVRRYDIDGVHFDDYFYPYEGTTTQDAETYHTNGRGISSIADWRRDNVNTFVRLVRDSIRAVKPWIKFGISPFGIWRSGTPSGIVGLDAYSVVYADALAWLQAGLVDYIAPQLYWKFGGGQDYAKLMPWWLAQARQAGRHLYTGLGAYRLTEDAWTASDITRQIDFNRTQASDGAVLFSSNAITRNLKNVQTALQTDTYKTFALPPTMPWKDSVPPNAPVIAGGRVHFTGSSAQLFWEKPSKASDGDTARYFIIYRLPFSSTDLNTATIIGITRQTVFTDTSDTLATQKGLWRYAVAALDKTYNQSTPSYIVFVSSIRAEQAVSKEGGTLNDIRPNPASDLVTLRYTLQKPSFISITLCDVLGNVVATPHNTFAASGTHSVEVDTTQFPSGVYMVRCVADGSVSMLRLVVQR